MPDWGWTEYPRLIYGIWSLFLLEKRIRVIKHVETCARTLKVRAAPHKLQKREKSDGMIDDPDNVDFISSNVHSFRKEILLYVFEDNEAVIKMIIKGRSLQWDMFPEPTELFLICCLIESIWTPRSKSSTFTPRTKIYWQSKISHVMNGIIFCVCSTSAISVPSIVWKRCRKERKKMQVKKESQQNHSRWWIWSRDTTWGIRTCLFRLHRWAWGKPNLKVRQYLWAR